MSNFIKSDKQARLIKFILCGLAIAIVLGFILFWLFGSEKVPTDSKLTSGNTENISGKAGGEGSHEYNSRLKEHDEQQANAALATGQSHVPSPVGASKPVVGKKEETKKPETPPVAQVRTVPPKPVKQDNAMLKRMMEDLAQLDAKLSATAVGQGKIEYLMDFEKAEKDKKKREKTDTAPASPSAPTPVLHVKPGDLLYAIVDTGVNSDVPSAVLATVASGPYRDARLLGSFQRHDERIVLSFSRLITKDGKALQLDAYAVDPATSEASVATSVNTHFFERWGGLVAASFLSGLGEAKRFSGAQSTVYGGVNGTSDRMVWNKYNPADQAWIAAGKVGEKAAEKFEKNFDRPPTVYLASGTPIGILVMNVKENR